MGSSEKTEYCAFIEAVEHLGDRPSRLTVSELALFGPQWFNTLATGLPGHTSRSVPTDKLRKLAALPGWFLPVARSGDARPLLSLPDAELAIEAAG
ncbi:MAG: hypothetical protein ABIO99_01475 [Candidatus Limnocylindria bacterium]